MHPCFCLMLHGITELCGHRQEANGRLECAELKTQLGWSLGVRLMLHDASQ